MPAIKQYNRHKPLPPIAFLHADSGAEVPRFIPGECMCKACKSRDLEYSSYLEDAKCKSCSQWQQEELIPL